MSSTSLGRTGRRLMWFAIGLILLFLVVGLLFRLLENGLIYFPQPLPHGSLERLLTGIPGEETETWEEVAIGTDDGETLTGWYGAPAEPRAHLLWLHGNGGNNSHRFDDLWRFVRGCRLAVLLLDYRGYGSSTGKPDEPGLYRDSRAAWDFLDRRGVDPSTVFFLGRSLGGAVAVELALEHPPRGLIIESTFTSVRDMAKKAFPWFPSWWFAKSTFQTDERITGLDVPILHFHGREDEVIPFSLGERLAAAARPGRLAFVPVDEAGHDDLSETLGREYFRRVQAFVVECLEGN